MTTHRFYINGYGIPHNIFKDGNYQSYFTTIIMYVLWIVKPGDRIVFYLSGGATDPRRPHMTEAREMYQLLREFIAMQPKLSDMDIAIEMIDDAIDSRTGLEGLLRRVEPDTDVSIFCEWTRQDLVRIIAWKYFTNAQVLPVAFEGTNRSNRLKRLPRTLLGSAGLYSELARRLELRQRRAFIDRVAAARPPVS